MRRLYLNRMKLYQSFRRRDFFNREQRDLEKKELDKMKIGEVWTFNSEIKEKDHEDYK